MRDIAPRNEPAQTTNGTKRPIVRHGSEEFVAHGVAGDTSWWLYASQASDRIALPRIRSLAPVRRFFMGSERRNAWPGG